MITCHYKRKTHARIKQPDLTGGKKVKVGYPSGKTTGFIILKAIWNHFGTSRGIPERPFLRNSMRANAARYREGMKSMAKRVLRGEMALHTSLARLGLAAVGDIQQTITDTMSPPNAPSTIRAKGSSHPLIDTGEMRAATTYAIE